MPFKKIGPNKYVSPSGKKFTERQVKLYYATDGFKKEPKTGKELKSKWSKMTKKG